MEEITSTTPSNTANDAADNTANDAADNTGTGDHMPPPPAPTPTQPVRRLYRGNGPVSGVAAGLADYFNVDPSLIRLGLAAGTLIAGPVVPIGYIAAWMIIPEADPAPVAPIMPAPTAAPAPAPAPTTGPVDGPGFVDDVDWSASDSARTSAPVPADLSPVEK